MQYRKRVVDPIVLADTGWHQPPVGSTMSEGHSKAPSLSRMLCLKEWITEPPSTYFFIHLFKAALAEFA